MFDKVRQHLADANKSYFEHQKFAFKASFNCLKSALTAFVHGIYPAFFEYNTSSTIKKMYNDMRPIYDFLEKKNKQ